MTDFLLLFPGQGSQKPGMAKDLADAYPEARAVWDEADAALGTPLSRVAFGGPAEELTLTHNAQPALLTHGAAVWAIVGKSIAPRVKAAAGHSLGEFTAYHAAGALPRIVAEEMDADWSKVKIDPNAVGDQVYGNPSRGFHQYTAGSATVTMLLVGESQTS